LTDEEFAALQEVGKGLTQRIIPTEQRDVLIALRYIKRSVGGFALTKEGKRRLAAGR
jgi:hypothetical protein